MASKDFLDELIEEGTQRDPEFPRMVDDAYARRLLARKLAERKPADVSKKNKRLGKKSSER